MFRFASSFGTIPCRAFESRCPGKSTGDTLSKLGVPPSQLFWAQDIHIVGCTFSLDLFLLSRLRCSTCLTTPCQFQRYHLNLRSWKMSQLPGKSSEFGRAGKYADCSRSHDETAPANRSNTTGQAQLQPSSPPSNPRGLTRQGLEPVRAAAGPDNHRGRLGSCSMLLAFDLQEFQMEMEKVMAKLKSLEDQLLREVLEKEFAGHKAVPQLDMRSAVAKTQRSPG